MSYQLDDLESSDPLDQMIHDLQSQTKNNKRHDIELTRKLNSAKLTKHGTTVPENVGISNPAYNQAKLFHKKGGRKGNKWSKKEREAYRMHNQ